MSCRPAPPVVYNSGLVLGQDNSGTYMKAELSAKDAHNLGIDLNAEYGALIAGDDGVVLNSPILNPNATISVSNGLAQMNAALASVNGVHATIAGDNEGVDIGANNGGTVRIVAIPQQSTVGATGAASPLPANPSAYLILNGLAIPAYAKS